MSADETSFSNIKQKTVPTMKYLKLSKKVSVSLPLLFLVSNTLFLYTALNFIRGSETYLELGDGVFHVNSKELLVGSSFFLKNFITDIWQGLTFCFLFFYFEADIFSELFGSKYAPYKV